VGRDRYLAQNNLNVSSYTARKFPVYFFKWPIWVPNPGYLPVHDLHHVVTGYSTGLIGEAEISAYELRGGCGSAMIFILCVGAIFLAAFVAPTRIWKAWRNSRSAQNLYRTDIPYESLLDMTIGDLRQHLGLPRNGLAA
jgi:ubiquinone biosynthesis protein Coq4